MLSKTKTKEKTPILVGGYGSGKTTKAIELMGNRPYLRFQANDIDIEDVFAHKEKGNTQCPGFYLTVWVNEYRNQ